MTALWLEPDQRFARQSAAPDLRLVEVDRADPFEFGEPEQEGGYDLRLVGQPRRVTRGTHRRGPSVAVRRRRTILAAMGLLLVGLALPLSGTGGNSHAAGSARAETAHAAIYTVRAGDTLWTIAEQVDPSADPRPLVSRLAAQIGSDTVVPGERIAVP